MANGLGAATWGALELMVPAATAATWHKSVCRYCGTGCGVLIGMRDGRVTDIRGDELAHNKGVICIKGAMLRELPYVKGRLTTPKNASPTESPKPMPFTPTWLEDGCPRTRRESSAKRSLV